MEYGHEHISPCASLARGERMVRVWGWTYRMYTRQHTTGSFIERVLFKKYINECKSPWEHVQHCVYLTNLKLQSYVVGHFDTR